MSSVSSRTISVEEAGKFAGTLNNPARMVQNYAGVSGASDDRNDIIIRGNYPLGVLWIMGGIDIPSPSHFSILGTTVGSISILNINNLSNSDFYTSAWTADYRNALSGVFGLKLRNGNNRNREYLAQVGFNGFEFMISLLLTTDSSLYCFKKESGRYIVVSLATNNWFLYPSAVRNSLKVW